MGLKKTVILKLQFGVENFKKLINGEKWIIFTYSSAQKYQPAELFAHLKKWSLIQVKLDLNCFRLNWFDLNRPKFFALLFRKLFHFPVISINLYGFRFELNRVSTEPNKGSNRGSPVFVLILKNYFLISLARLYEA